MQQKQMAIQKIAVRGALILSAIMIVYALGFSTNLYNLSYHGDPASALFYVPGAELYREVQPFNRQLLKNVILLFLLCLTLFLTLSHKRRLYYISNYITSIAYSVYAAYLAYALFHYCSLYKEKFLQVDFVRYKEVSDMMNSSYTESTFMLDAGIVLGVLLMVFAVLLIVNLVMKFMWMKEEKWLTTGVTANES